MKIIAYALSWSVLAVYSLSLSSATAAESPPKPTPPAVDESFALKPMDGVTIEAIETYPTVKNNEIGLNVGIYPFNSYYYGLLVGGHFQHRLSQSASWEVVNAGYSFTFDKGLTTELADHFNVNPKVIDRLSFMISSNLLFSLMDGKFILLNNHLRFFRTSVLTGLGFVNTTARSSMAVNVGFRFEVFVTDSISWKLDVRDCITTSSFSNYVTFALGSGLAF